MTTSAISPSPRGANERIPREPDRAAYRPPRYGLALVVALCRRGFLPSDQASPDGGRERHSLTDASPLEGAITEQKWSAKSPGDDRKKRQPTGTDHDAKTPGLGPFLMVTAGQRAGRNRIP